MPSGPDHRPGLQGQAEGFESSPGPTSQPKADLGEDCLAPAKPAQIRQLL